MADTFSAKKVVISVDSENVQQEQLQASRRTLKVIQSDATDKENLVGRHSTLLNHKLSLESSVAKTTPTLEKPKKKVVHQYCQTVETGPSSITIDDLTSVEGPSEKYWERLAEQRRSALEDSLIENERLHGRLSSLQEELNVTTEMLNETKNLAEVLAEMLEEREATEQNPPQPAEQNNLNAED